MLELQTNGRYIRKFREENIWVEFDHFFRFTFSRPRRGANFRLAGAEITTVLPLIFDTVLWSHAEK